MTISTILASIDGLRGCDATLATALAVGKAFDAHVELLHVEVPPESAIPMVGEGMTGAVIEEIMESAKQNAARRLKEARDHYERLCVQAGLDLAAPGDPPQADRFTVTWRQVSGLEGDEIAARGRFFDLVVLAPPDGESGNRFNDVLESAIFESGRPVLVAPAAAPAPTCRCVAVAWHDSREAARGVWAAMPFLEKAEHVVLLAVTEDRKVADLTELARHLACHGITAEIRSLEPDKRSTGEQLLDEAKAAQADLLVMGAYGHSRLRELVLGGVTRDVLEKATVCALMAH